MIYDQSDAIHNKFRKWAIGFCIGFMYVPYWLLLTTFPVLLESRSRLLSYTLWVGIGLFYAGLLLLLFWFGDAVDEVFITDVMDNEVREAVARAYMSEAAVC